MWILIKMTRCFFISGKKSYLDYSELRWRGFILKSWKWNMFHSNVFLYFWKEKLFEFCRLRIYFMMRFHFEILEIKRVSLFLERKVICVIWILSIMRLFYDEVSFWNPGCFFISGKKNYLDYSEFEFRRLCI